MLFGRPPHNKWWNPAKPESVFIADLLETKGTDDSVLDRRVRHILRAMRFRKAAQPWLDMVKPIVTPIDRFYEVVSEFFRREEPSSIPQTGIMASHGLGTASVFPPPPNPAWVTGFPPQATMPVPVFEDAGIKVGEVTAYRAWFLHKDGLLHSIYMRDFAWAPGIPVEGDPVTGDGVHAFKKYEDVDSYAGDNDDCQYVIILGTVHLYGSVYEHERGYRASHAMIASIDDAPLDEAGKPLYDAPALRKKYKLDEPSTEQQPSDE